jgi:hypothetical protein
LSNAQRIMLISFGLGLAVDEKCLLKVLPSISAENSATT